MLRNIHQPVTKLVPRCPPNVKCAIFTRLDIRLLHPIRPDCYPYSLTSLYSPCGKELFFLSRVFLTRKGKWKKENERGKTREDIFSPSFYLILKYLVVLLRTWTFQKEYDATTLYRHRCYPTFRRFCSFTCGLYCKGVRLCYTSREKFMKNCIEKKKHH